MNYDPAGNSGKAWTGKEMAPAGTVKETAACRAASGGSGICAGCALISNVPARGTSPDRKSGSAW